MWRNPGFPRIKSGVTPGYALTRQAVPCAASRPSAAAPRPSPALADVRVAGESYRVRSYLLAEPHGSSRRAPVPTQAVTRATRAGSAEHCAGARARVRVVAAQARLASRPAHGAPAPAVPTSGARASAQAWVAPAHRLPWVRWFRVRRSARSRFRGPRSAAPAEQAAVQSIAAERDRPGDRARGVARLDPGRHHAAGRVGGECLHARRHALRRVVLA